MAYFSENLDNFGIVLKGSSVRHLSDFADNFDHCFMVNNFDRNIENENSEWSTVAPHLRGKEIAHFVNRLTTAPLLQEHYEELNIKHVQFSKMKIDHMIAAVKPYYEQCGLQCHFLPEAALAYNDFFEDKYFLKPGDSNYSKKHPNTGVLAVIYAAHILKAKNVWIVGLDFYQSDYLHRRPWQTPLERQQLKMKNTDMIGHFADVIQRNQDIQFNLVTKAKNIPKLNNLRVFEV
jgi:hypothetical protein